ncbi:MAG TPA: hypothetical protein VHU86_08875 [Solirubrobacterales bacterium]|jgi:hypothetical protein|nr:hypothetical protein [Solirubrobacterales bacterium]
MPVSEIILMNVVFAAVVVAILALVMLIPARLDAQHPATHKERKRKIDGRRAAIGDQRAPGARGRPLWPIRDQN